MTDTHDQNDQIDSQSFIVPASDLKGHSTRMQFRCQAQMAYQTTLIFESHKFPFRTKGEILRYCVLAGLKQLESMAPVKSVLAEVDIINDILRAEEFAEIFSGVFERLASRIAAFMGQGETGEAIRLIRNIQDRIDKMEEGYWKDKYGNEIESRWGYLVKEAKKAKLKFGGDEK